MDGWRNRLVPLAQAFYVAFDGLPDVVERLLSRCALRDTTWKRGNGCNECTVFVHFDNDPKLHEGPSSSRDKSSIQQPTILLAKLESKADRLRSTKGQDIVADDAHTALTLRRHPLALLRERFTAMRLKTAAQVNSARQRQPIRTVGIVTCRQRPSTASGVTFVTLEDETGTINVVVWRSTAEKYRRELLGSTLLTVYGHVERVETSVVPVVHLIAARLADHSGLLGDLTVASRDFH
jgi:DNA polymerase III alpha subunit